MRKVALAIAAMLVLAIVSPAFSQPFADVPTDHWAFDAIAELAAKGLVEGYPDGTFKGDRAMTRYEIAMVVARLLARIEAIKIPAPPAPPKIDVSRADITTLQRLINEFRAELAALGVRVTAVEEELAALRSRLDNTFITGDLTYVYVTGPYADPGLPEVQRNRARLTFRGRVGSHTATFLRARWNSRWPSADVTDFDRVYWEYAAPFGFTFRVGQDYWGLGPVGTLMTQYAATEGARAMGGFGPLSLTALGAFNQNDTASSTLGVRAAVTLIPGWETGINYRSDRNPTAATFVGSGWSFDFSGNIIANLALSGEFASYTTGGVGTTAYFVNLGLGGMLPSPVSDANIWYKNYPAGWAGVPTCGGAICTNTYAVGGFWLGADMNYVTAFGADVTFNVTQNFSAYVAYESGTANAAYAGVLSSIAATNRYSAYVVQGNLQLGHNSRIGAEYYTLNNGTSGLNVENGYAVYITHRW